MLRSAPILFFCILLCGCGDRSLLADGPGTALQVNDTVDRAKLQGDYFRLVCAATSLPRNDGPGGPCPVSDDPGWRRVVFVAMNDIDDRCEAYVSSLRRIHREQETVQSELVKVASSTDRVLGIVLDKTKSVNTLLLVQQAFGVARESLSAYYSRLLLAISPDLIQQTLLKRQTAFRVGLNEGVPVDLAKKPGDAPKTETRRIIIASRADAYYVIRVYLRLCLPETLEASLNEGIEDQSFLVPLTTAEVAANTALANKVATQFRFPSQTINGAITGRPPPQPPATVYAPRRIDPSIEALGAGRAR